MKQTDKKFVEFEEIMMAEEKKCVYCDAKLTFSNTPNFGSGQLNDGGRVCRKCFSKIAKLDIGFGLNSKKNYSSEDVKRCLDNNVSKKGLNQIANNEIINNSAQPNMNDSLSAIEKLQFRKYIAEESGIEINQVEMFLESIDEFEKKELIQLFKLQQNNKTQKNKKIKENINIPKNQNHEIKGGKASIFLIFLGIILVIYFLTQITTSNNNTQQAKIKGTIQNYEQTITNMLVVGEWNGVIKKLKSIPEKDENYNYAQQKLKRLLKGYSLFKNARGRWNCLADGEVLNSCMDLSGKTAGYSSRFEGNTWFVKYAGSDKWEIDKRFIGYLDNGHLIVASFYKGKFEEFIEIWQ